MSEENVEVVREAIDEYYGAATCAEAEAIFDPEVVLDPIDEAAVVAVFEADASLTWSAGPSASTNSR